MARAVSGATHAYEVRHRTQQQRREEPRLTLWVLERRGEVARATRRGGTRRAGAIGESLQLAAYPFCIQPLAPGSPSLQLAQQESTKALQRERGKGRHRSPRPDVGGGAARGSRSNKPQAGTHRERAIRGRATEAKGRGEVEWVHTDEKRREGQGKGGANETVTERAEERGWGMRECGGARDRERSVGVM